MRIFWEVAGEDVQAVKALIDAQLNNPLVQDRHKRNVLRQEIALSRETVWAELVACLVTTQQSWAVAKRFLQLEPFPLSYGLSLQSKGAREWAEGTLKEAGFWLWKRVAGELVANLDRLESGLWERALSVMESLRDPTDSVRERSAADFIDDHFAGFGPKQARNLLQGLGLTRYEIPFDSRVAKWLTTFGFPVPVSAGALGDQHYYHFVSDGVQHLCAECGVYPCILDAAIFVSFEREQPAV